MSLCVYAVTTRSAGLTAVRGLAGERLRRVAVGTVAAIVGELGRTPPSSVTVLRRYDRVVRSLSSSRAAVLPARFGSCFRTLEELTAAFRSRERALARALRHVRGRVQMTIRVIGPQSPHGPPEGGPHLRSSSGAIYLKERAARAARERQIPGFDPVRDAVRRWVRDEQVEKSEGVASVYHLVPRASADAYRRAASRAAQSAGLDVVITGPHPAYAFA